MARPLEQQSDHPARVTQLLRYMRRAPRYATFAAGLPKRGWLDRCGIAFSGPLWPDESSQNQQHLPGRYPDRLHRARPRQDTHVLGPCQSSCPAEPRDVGGSRQRSRRDVEAVTGGPGRRLWPRARAHCAGSGRSGACHGTGQQATNRHRFSRVLAGRTRFRARAAAVPAPSRGSPLLYPPFAAQVFQVLGLFPLKLAAWLFT